MAKNRMIRSEIWTDEKFVSLEPLARLLFIGMWHHACDNGHLDDSPLQLKMRVLPADSCDAEELIEQIVATGMVIRGAGYLKVANLARRQKIDGRYALLCDHCEHDEHTVWGEADKAPRTAGARREHDEDPAGAHVGPAGARAKVREGKVREEKGAGRKRPARTLPPDWAPKDKHQELAREKGADINSEAEAFMAHAQANDRRLVDWDAGFRQWLTKARPSTQPSSGWVQREQNRLWGAS